MRGRKEVLWAVVISAALFTAGLILSCGDDGDDNGGVEVSCQDVCEKFEECEEIPGFFGDTVEDCEDACEEVLAGDGGELAEAFQCAVDTDYCEDVIGNCFCPTVCEKLDYCDAFGYWNLDSMAMCVFTCLFGYYYEDFPMEGIMCYFGFSSCWFIWDFCDFIYFGL